MPVSLPPEALEDERRWTKSFEDSADLLELLADEALADRRAGNTEPLNSCEL